jgi:uncharacterized protein
MKESLELKRERIIEVLRPLSSAMVSYSGGVDSTLVAALAHQILQESMLAVIVESPLHPPRELAKAKETARALGLPLQSMEVHEISIPDFKDNPPRRCYLCKKHRLTFLKKKASAEGWDAVLDGSNADDAAMHRPGGKALKELGVISPLQTAGLVKSDIRALAKKLALPNWDTPSHPCLATRFPYGMELSTDLLKRVDAAEEMLEGIGLRQVRVRLQAPDQALIEVERGEMARLYEKDNQNQVVKKLRGLGFRRILLDEDGYRSGSMDEQGRPKRCRTLYSAEV